MPVWAPLQSTCHDDTVIFPDTVIPLLQVTLWLTVMGLAQGYSPEVRELAYYAQDSGFESTNTRGECTHNAYLHTHIHT